MSSELRAAIENLYAAFNDVPKPESIEGCPCCIERKGVDVLLSKPLREITPDELRNYAFSAFFTIGSLPDYQYFLPRILEILAIDRCWSPDPETVAHALKKADFEAWSEVHHAAVIRYFDAKFDDVLAGDDDLELDSWICAFGRLFPSVAPYLNRLSQFPAKALAYYEQNSKSMIKGQLTNNFWEDDLPAYHQVLAWFKSPDIERMIRESYGL